MNATLRGRVLRRLGLESAPGADLAGLRALYGFWCAHVPFDNLRKMLALRKAATAPLPGMDADDFFEHWLRHGCGGTCWPSSNALFELLASLGFAARRAAGAMGDSGVANHSTVLVACDGSDWLLDSSMLTNSPLPVRPELFISGDRVFGAEVEPSQGTHVVWFDIPPNSTFLACRLLPGGVDHRQCILAFEATRERSVFNSRLYVRRNRPGELLLLVGPERISRTALGVEERRLSREELCRSLRVDFGISGALVGEWTECGALEATFEAPAEPLAPPGAQVPPSLRSAGPR